MVAFHAKGKLELTVLIDDFRIAHFIEKCLGAIFGFQIGIMHILKDNVYGDNNNVIKSVYQAPLPIPQGLEWTFNAERFRIISENLPKSSHNVVLMSSTTTFIVNVTTIVLRTNQWVSF
jgi:hypothetical protein